LDVRVFCVQFVDLLASSMASVAANTAKQRTQRQIALENTELDLAYSKPLDA
jgi:hypothetical protein